MPLSKDYIEEKAAEDRQLKQLMAEAKRLGRGCSRAIVITEEHLRDLTTQLIDGRGGTVLSYLWILFLTHGWGHQTHSLAASYIDMATNGTLNGERFKKAVRMLEQTDLIETELVGCGRGKFQVKRISTKWQPVLATTATRTNVIRPEVQEIIDAYKEICGATGPKGSGVNKLQAARNIMRLLKEGKNKHQLIECIKRYKESKQFNGDFVYKISNFFGGKGYYENFMPTVVLSDTDAARSASNCNAAVTTQWCEWQLYTKDYAYCKFCERQKIGRADW